MSARETIFGAKGGGGGSQHTPVESPDTAQSISYGRMIVLLGHGETGGPADPANPLKSIYLDDTPIQNPDGSFNFQNMQVSYRTGTQTQPAISGFPAVETEIGVGLEVKAANPITQTVADVNATAIRVTVSLPAGLRSTDPKTGDTSGASVQYAIDLAPTNGKFAQAAIVTISDKTAANYQRSTRLPLTGVGPWLVRVRRITPDSTTQYLANQTVFTSFTSIIDAQLRYPNLSVLALKFDARQFSRMPTVSVLWQQLKCQVPSNYDPVARTYTGPWDGNFKPAVTSNPVWYLWTYCTDNRFGINIPAANMDRWGMYAIAQWCDQLVPDGYGGFEPRFQFHNFQQDTQDAWKVVSDIVSSFCGQAYWSAGGIRIVADMPGKQPVKHFNATNVIDGKFTYSSTPKNGRFTAAAVAWTDPSDRYRRAVEYAEHGQGLLTYGLQQTSAVAMGAVTRGQARRCGRYILETAQRCTEMVTFKAAAYGADLQPGDLFATSDFHVAGARMGGRVLSVAGTVVKLDAPVTLQSGVTYTLEVTGPDGVPVRRGVVAPPSTTDTLSIVSPYPAQPVAGATWVLIATNLQPDLWTCVSIKSVDSEFEISGLQYDPNKWAAIETGLRFDPAPTSNLPDPGAMPPVLAVQLQEQPSLAPDGSRKVKLLVDWPAVVHPYLRSYRVTYRQNGGNWVALPDQVSNHAEILDVVPGNYDVRVSTVSVTGVVSIPVTGNQQTQGQVTPPPAPTLTAVGGAMKIDLSWTYPAGRPDIARAELFYSTTSGDSNPSKLADLAFPTSTFSWHGLQLGVTYYFWLRVYDTWGNPSAFAQTLAQSVKDPGALLDQLKDSITSAQLQESLRTPIEQAANVQGSVNSLVQAAMQQMLTADEIRGTQGNHYAFAKRQLGTLGDSLRQEANERLLLAARVDEAAAGIAEESRARAAADSTLTERVGTMQTTVNGHTASLQEVSRTVDGITAEKIIKLNSAGKVAGIGLRTDPNGSAVDVLADRFVVSLPDGSGSRQVFVVSSINGRPALGLAGDLIADGSLIGRRVLVDGSVDARQINSQGLTIRDMAGSVVVDMTGVGAAYIKGKLSVGQIDTEGLRITRNGATVVDATGMDGAYIRNLMVDTLQIKGEAVTKADTRTISVSGWVNTFDYWFSFYCADAGTLLCFAEAPPPLNGATLYARDRSVGLSSMSGVIVLSVSAGETVRLGCRASFDSAYANTSLRYGCVLFRR
ncbi:host specificity protein J [Chromobacterium phragmitis]|uniref:host specificity protein J n=1 Tax=Chromobacterium amazonense TaxID=1382803 RepID=UPI0021B7B1D9|nr:phage tail protein [Chromobacterium amazonense]MBM2883901.1 host specificity protein J [Chromobacterium amazonense]MDE1711818.1 phage tail protein [Chromobacterium amazonense]